MLPGGGQHSFAFNVGPAVGHVWEFGVRTFQRHPLLVKTVTSGIGFAAGDALMQLSTTRRRGEAFNWERTLKMGMAGGFVAGPLGYLFIQWMEGHVMTGAPASRLAVTTKVTLDQLLGGLIWQAALLSIYPPYRQDAEAFLQHSLRRQKVPAAIAAKPAAGGGRPARRRQ